MLPKLAGMAAVIVVATVGVLMASRPVSKPDMKVVEITATPAVQRSVYVGAWVYGFWDNATKTLNVEGLKKLEGTIGKMAMANIYADWQYLANPELITDLTEISDNGWTPIVSSNPFFFSGCKDTGKPLYAAIARGDCDTFLSVVGENLRNYGKPVFLRFAWEMNLPSMYWSVSALKSSPQDFIGAWRRFHKLVREQGADNVVWVLSFNTSSASTTPYKDLYPGDEYVDWVAIDGYNWGTAQNWSKWTNFDGVFWKSYKELTDISDKPLMLSEVNSAPDGGDKAAWLTNMLTEEIPASYPNVAAIVFFNENKMQGENVDWRLEKSQKYIDAVKDGLALPLYRRVYP